MAGLPSLAKNGLSPHRNNRNVAHRDAGGGRRPPHQTRTMRDFDTPSLDGARAWRRGAQLIKPGEIMAEPDGESLDYDLGEIETSKCPSGKNLICWNRL